MTNFDITKYHDYLIFDKRKSISNVRKNLYWKNYDRFQ